MKLFRLGRGLRALAAIVILAVLSGAAFAQTWRPVSGNSSSMAASSAFTVPASLTVAPVTTFGTSGACTPLSITNNGATTLQNLLVTAFSGTTTAFAACTYGTNACGSTLAAGASCNYGLQLAGVALFGDNTETVTVGATGTGYQYVKILGTNSSTINPFSFTNVTGQALSSTTTATASPAPSWSGGATLTASITSCLSSSCTIQCNGTGSFGSTCNIASGQQLSVQVANSGNYNSLSSVTVALGGLTQTFSSTTVQTPSAFNFNNNGTTGNAFSSTVIGTATPTWGAGGTLTATPSCSNSTCTVSCNGGSYASSCSLTSGQTLNLAMVEPAAAYSSTGTGTVTVGMTTSGPFTATTVATANAFTIPTVISGMSSTVTSSTTPTWSGGGTLTATMGTCTGTSCLVSCNGGSYASSCTLTSGQTLSVEQTDSPTYNTSTSATVTVGNTASTFTATTSATANVFTIPTVISGMSSTVASSATPTWSGGGTLTATMGTCTGTSCLVSCNGGAYAASCTLTSGQTLSVKQTNSATYNTSTTATVTVGNTSSTFTATTSDTSAAFAFTAVTGVALSSTTSTTASTKPSWSTGGSLTASVTSCGGSSCLVSCNGGAYASTCTLTTGQSLAVQETTGTSPNTAYPVTVQVGSTTATASFTTAITASLFSFSGSGTTGNAFSSTVIGTATPTWPGGGTLTATPSTCTNGTCTVSCNGGSYSSSCSLTSGQTLQLKVITSPVPSTTSTAIVTVGITPSSSFTATTGAGYLVGTYNGTNIYALASCASGNYYCQAQAACQAATGATCVWQSYTCSTYPNQNGSFYPTSDPKGWGIPTSGSSNLNWAVTSSPTATSQPTYGNVCSCYSSIWTYPGLVSCGYGEWQPY